MGRKIENSDEVERRFQALFEYSSDVILIHDLKGRIVDANPKATEEMGYTHDEFLTLSAQDLHPPDALEASQRAFQEVASTGVSRFETSILCKDGLVFPAEVSSSLLTVAGQELVLGLVRKISEEKHSEERNEAARLEALQSIEKLEAVLRTAGEGIISINEQGLIILVNDEVSSIFGYSREELEGLELTELMPEQYRAGHSAGMERYLAGGAARVLGTRLELEGLRKEGEAFPLELRITETQTGHGLFFTAAVRDISERKRAREDKERTRSLLHSIRTAQGRFIGEASLQLIFDQLLCDLLGLTGSPCGFIGEVFTLEEDKLLLETHFVADLSRKEGAPSKPQEGDSRSLTISGPEALLGKVLKEKRFVISDEPGQEAWLEELTRGEPPLTDFLGVPFLIEEEVVGMVGLANRPGGYDEELAAFLEPLTSTCAGIIQAHRAEEGRQTAQQALSEADARMRAVFDTAVDPIIVINQTGTIEMFNKAAVEVFGYPREDVIGMNVNVLMPSPYHENHNDYLRNYLATGDSKILGVGREVVGRRADGNEFPLDLSVSETLLSGERRIFVGIVRDITERKSFEAELHTAKETAEKAAKAKDEFLATMSHEIRTPMNAVMGMSSLLAGTDLDEEQRYFCKTIQTSGNFLLTIINDILDFSAIESGQIHLEAEPFDLMECLEEAVDLVTVLASQKRIDLVTLVDAGVPSNLKGDVSRLRQVLVNLLSNAVKFTEEGQIVVSVREAKREASGAATPLQSKREVSLQFSVQDTGIGISEEQANNLFQAFSQGDASIRRNYGGTGLGLAISKRLTEHMGGRIWIESELGRGSTFRFTVLLQTSLDRRSAVSEGLRPLLDGKEALTLCGKSLHHEVLRLYGSRVGLRVTGFTEPQELEQALARGQKPDLLFLDEVVGKGILESGVTTRWGIPVVLLATTTGADPVPTAKNDVHSGLRLLRPVRFSSFLDVLYTGLKLNGTSKLGTKESLRDSALASLTILIAEDNSINQQVALKMLQKLGSQADLVSSGAEALEALSRREYDVILMDIQMPEMDGLQATKEIRRAYPESPIWIVALTAAAMEGDRERCLKAGMDDYVSKPLRLKDLAEVIARVPVGRQTDDTEA
jgi:PAS domain S-box-containing protein